MPVKYRNHWPKPISSINFTQVLPVSFSMPIKKNTKATAPRNIQSLADSFGTAAANLDTRLCCNVPVPDIPIGTRGEERRRVTPEIAIDFLGLPGARVLGTPFMIMWMEMTCRNSVQPRLGDGHDTLGTDIRIRMRTATPHG